MPDDPPQWRLRSDIVALRVTAGSLWGGDGAAAWPALAGRHYAPIVIIGGGIAGLSLALHLAEAGEAPMLIEADLIGGGATGASAGLVAPQLVRTTPAAVLDRLGPERGGALLRMVADGGTCLFDLVARHGIDCDARPRGFLAPATGRDAGAMLATRVAQWRAFRDDLRVADADETRALTGCRGYGAAIVDPSGGAIDPVLFARGLARAAAAAGARLHEHAPVLRIERDGAGWAVVTAAGRIVAARLVLAANGGNAALHPALAATVLPLPVCQVATEPLPGDMAAMILPQGQAMTDLAPDVFSLRHAAGGRLMTAYPARDGQGTAAIEAGVNARLAAMLVTARPLRLDHVWRGTAWVNASLLPRLVQVDAGLVAVQACNGRGLAINAILGRDLARAMIDPGAATIGFDAPQRVAGFGLAQHLPRLALAAALAAKRLRARFGS